MLSETQSRLITRQRVKGEGLRRFAPLAYRVKVFFAGALILAACLGLTAVLAFAGKLLWVFIVRSDYFEIRQVDFSPGISPEVREELLALARIQPGTGVNLVCLDVDETRERILTNPKMRQATVIKAYPRRLIIEGAERKPVAIVASGGFFAIDEVGTVLGPVDIKTYRDGYPILTGIAPEALVQGRRLKAPHMIETLDLLGTLRRVNRQLHDQISEARLDAHEGITLYLRGGMEARLGTGPAVDKMPALELYLRDHPDPKETLYVDLRFCNLPDKPQIVYRLRDATQP